MKPRVIGHGDNAYQAAERVGTPAPRPMPELAWRVSKPWSLEAEGFHESERWQKWCDDERWPSPALANELRRGRAA